jgi:hypothetical protein
MVGGANPGAVFNGVILSAAAATYAAATHHPFPDYLLACCWEPLGMQGLHCKRIVAIMTIPCLHMALRSLLMFPDENG